MHELRFDETPPRCRRLDRRGDHSAPPRIPPRQRSTDDDGKCCSSRQHTELCVVSRRFDASGSTVNTANSMSRTTTAGPFTRVFGALLVFVLVVAALPHCAMACCCETMPAKGTLPTAAARCSGPCEDRNQTIATSPQDVSSDATFTPPLISAVVATAARVEPPAAALWSPANGQRGAAPASLAIYLRDRSLLI